MTAMKIQANLRFSLSQKVEVLVGFLPGLADLPVRPSPGIISPLVASLAFHAASSLELVPQGKPAEERGCCAPWQGLVGHLHLLT